VDNAEALVMRRVPAPTSEETEHAILEALARLVALGITSVHDAGVDASTLAVYRRVAERHALPIHVYAMIDGQAPMAEGAPRPSAAASPKATSPTRPS
jgi:predicted amidohydrolase YtcJ